MNQTEQQSPGLRWRKAVVVGASSGIGEAIARHLAASGTSVALVARRTEALERICEEINAAANARRALAFPHDVRHPDQARDLLQRIARELQGLDLIVYAAGILPRTGSQEYPTDKDVDTIATNFTGAVAWLNAAALRFTEMQSGTIIGISSVAGERGRRGNPVYNATKSALNTYLEALRCRLTSRSVTVLTAKCGWVRTPMVGDARFPLPVATAEAAARDIVMAAAAGRRVVYVPAWWRWIVVALHAIPAPLYERLPIP